MSKEFMSLSQDELIAGFLSKTDRNKLHLDNTQKMFPYGYHLIWGASGKNICLNPETVPRTGKCFYESLQRCSLRKHPFLLALRRRGRFVRRNGWRVFKKNKNVMCWPTRWLWHVKQVQDYDTLTWHCGYKASVFSNLFLNFRICWCNKSITWSRSKGECWEQSWKNCCSAWSLCW